MVEVRCIGVRRGGKQELLTIMSWNDGRLTKRRYNMIRMELDFLCRYDGYSVVYATISNEYGPVGYLEYKRVEKLTSPGVYRFENLRSAKTGRYYTRAFHETKEVA